ncbi:hypothetical protein C0993_004590 [Termitomyces sp. T159_Od127]|nr:hypothetical protein C0993_004590 [Termitomyces sp. T159_Od127]
MSTQPITSHKKHRINVYRDSDETKFLHLVTPYFIQAKKEQKAQEFYEALYILWADRFPGTIHNIVGQTIEEYDVVIRHRVLCNIILLAYIYEHAFTGDEEELKTWEVSMSLEADRCFRLKNLPITVVE